MPHPPAPLDLRDRYRGALLGLAVGDAVGTTVEFMRRGSFPPVVDMMGGGPFGLTPGQWTDDTSMALCLASSLVECKGFDPADQMQRYCRWRDEGYWSATGRCFDIGNTVAGSLRRFKATGDPMAGSTDPNTAGNGSIMRLAPVALWFHGDDAALEDHAALSSRTTHGAEECVDACRWLARAISRALDGASRAQVLLGDAGGFAAAPAIAAIARGAWQGKPRDEIRGSGYVVESLEAAAWSLGHTESFEDAILTAANLGDDADTTAAVCGQLAGACYGVSGIPARWVERLSHGEAITQLADALLVARPGIVPI